MAQLTISLSGSSVVNGSKSWTLSDADVQKLIDYMIVKYTFKRGPKQPAVVPPTAIQALNFWVSSFVDNTVAEITSSQRDKAAKAAEAAVTPITFT